MVEERGGQGNRKEKAARLFSSVPIREMEGLKKARFSCTRERRGKRRLKRGVGKSSKKELAGNRRLEGVGSENENPVEQPGAGERRVSWRRRERRKSLERRRRRLNLSGHQAEGGKKRESRSASPL